MRTAVISFIAGVLVTSAVAIALRTHELGSCRSLLKSMVEHWREAERENEELQAQIDAAAEASR